MQNYLLITSSEDGDIGVNLFDKAVLTEKLMNGDFGNLDFFHPSDTINPDPMYWKKDLLVEVGNVIQPVPVTTQWKLPD